MENQTNTIETETKETVAAPAFSEAQLAQIASVAAQIANQTVSAREKRIAAKQAQEPKEAKEPKEDTSQYSATEVALLKRIESFERREKDSLKREREKDSTDHLRKSLNGKIKAEAVDTVLDLFKGRGIINHETRQLKLNGEEMDYDTGIQAYLQSAEAKYFLEAPQAQPIRHNTSQQANPFRSSSLASSPSASNLKDTLKNNSNLSKDEQFALLLSSIKPHQS